MKIILFATFIVYIVTWLSSMIILLTNLSSGYNHGLTKAEVRWSLLVPYYWEIKKAYNNYKQLK